MIPVLNDKEFIYHTWRANPFLTQTLLVLLVLPRVEQSPIRTFHLVSVLGA